MIAKLRAWIRRFFSLLPQTPAPVLPAVKPNFPLDKVEAAFESGGVTYYKFIDPGDMSMARRYASEDRVLEIENRVTNDYLRLHCKLTDEAINNGKITIIEDLNRSLWDRVDHLSNYEFLYNIASVWYFDANEDVYSYSFEYADKKIARWKKDPETMDFFLASPLKNYMHLPDSYGMNIQSFSLAVLKQERAMLSIILPRLLKQNADQDTISSTSSRLETLNAWIELLK